MLSTQNCSISITFKSVAKTVAQNSPGDTVCTFDCLLKQRGCVVCFTEDTQELAGLDTVPCALGRPCPSREVGPDDSLWSLPTLTILSFCENSDSMISSDCILKQKPPAESHSKQGQRNWKQQCCTTNGISYEDVIGSLHGQKSTHTGQETGNAGINVQQRREDILYYPLKAHHIQHTIVQ